MRDLATYESNYGEASGLRTRFQRIIQAVSGTKACLAMNVKFSKDGEPGGSIEDDENDSPGLQMDPEGQQMLQDGQNEPAQEIQ